MLIREEIVGTPCGGGSEVSKVEQVGTEQATIVVWGSVLLRSQNGHRTCLMAPQVLGGGGKCSTVFLAAPGGRQLTMKGISNPVLTAGPGILRSRTRAPRAEESMWKEGVSHMTRALGVVALRL